MAASWRGSGGGIGEIISRGSGSANICIENNQHGVRVYSRSMYENQSAISAYVIAHQHLFMSVSGVAAAAAIRRLSV